MVKIPLINKKYVLTIINGKQIIIPDNKFLFIFKVMLFFEKTNGTEKKIKATMFANDNEIKIRIAGTI